MVGRFETFTLAISELSQYWHKIASEEMKAYDLKGAYAIYLVALKNHPEGITAANLCEACSRDKAEISRAVSVMEKRGLAERESTGIGSYRALIKLTDKGKVAAEHVCRRAKLAVEIGGKGLTDEHREIFYKSLELIVSNLKNVCKEGLPK